MKGFKDANNKFHPINNKKGVRKSRDQSAKTEGIRLKRKQKVIKIEVMDGVVNDVYDLPKGYAYDIVEVDHFGKPIREVRHCDVCDEDQSAHEDSSCEFCGNKLKEKFDWSRHG